MAVCWTNRQLSVTAKYQSRFGVPFAQAFSWKSMLQLYTPRTKTFEWTDGSTWFARISGTYSSAQTDTWTVAPETWATAAIQIYGFDWNFVPTNYTSASQWCYFA